MPTTTAAPIVKRCSKCGTDVTGAKRLKDAKGHYWCTDCGAPESVAGVQSLLTPCPRCHMPVHPTHFVRKDGQYVCENCAAGVKAAGGKGLTDAQAASRKKLILAAVLVGAGVASYGLLNFVVFA